MNEPTFCERRIRFQGVCSAVRNSLAKTEEKLESCYLDEAKQAELDLWTEQGLRELFRSLYGAEKLISKRFRDDAERWSDSETGLLDRCRKIIVEIDAKARAAKLSLPDEIGCEDSLLHEYRCILRRLVRRHWAVLDSLKKQEEDIQNLIHKEIGQIERALNQLAWLTCVFISYAHADNESPSIPYLNHLLECIRRPLQQEHIFLWWDRKEPCDGTMDFSSRGILAGENWNAKILNCLRNLDVAMTLVSPNFVKSEYVSKTEIRKMWNRRRQQGLYVIPIRLRQLETQADPEFQATQAFPTPEYLADCCQNNLSPGMMERCSKELVQMIKNAFEICSDPETLEGYRKTWQQPLTAGAV